MGIKSANDCVHRDPDKITLSIPKDSSDDCDEWVEVVTWNLNFEDRRWHTLKFILEDEVTCNKIKFDCWNSKSHEF